MLQPRSIQSSLGIRDKILSLDYVLVISILVLGIISMFAMYSTDGGEFKYHTNSHILRFFIFFGLFLVISLFILTLCFGLVINIECVDFFTSIKGIQTTTSKGLSPA